MVTSTADKTKKDASQVKVEPKDLTAPGKGLSGKEGGAETIPEKIYRQSEVDAQLARAGQRIQAKLDAVTAERDTFRTQAETLTAEITEAKESIASLTQEIEAMSMDDPEKLGLVKLRRAKETELKALKLERAEVADSKAEIVQWKRDQLVFGVADEFTTADGGNVDMDAFKARADRFNLSEREELEALAETMGLKLKTEEPQEPEAPPPKPYSGRTDGGSDNLGSLTPVERVKETDRRLRAK